MHVSIKLVNCSSSIRRLRQHAVAVAAVEAAAAAAEEAAAERR